MPHDAALFQPARTGTMSLPVAGMTCAACSARLERVLAKVPGVASASVSLAAERAEIQGEAAPEELAEAIEKAGFSVPLESLRLAVSGMTCAACASRVEKVLGRLPGVREVSVNLATERAALKILPGAVSASGLIDAVQRAGFGASLVVDGAARDAGAEAEAARRTRRDLLTLAGAALLTLPLVGQMLLELMGAHVMLPPWIQMALATPVQFWMGGRFFTGAWKALRGGSANMDVLVVMGTMAAYGL
ncbi:MAG: heavy metal translocating P-type ATPase, partial [Rhodospirillales bacterium]|nr:heavy metal translocating P-type ATPase [Rhodospirillales bacterium]